MFVAVRNPVRVLLWLLSLGSVHFDIHASFGLRVTAYTEKIDGSLIGVGSELYVVQFGCDECLYCYVYRRWQISGLSLQLKMKNIIEERLTTFLKLVMYNETCVTRLMMHNLASCFGHLENINILAFNGQQVHELSICRVANQGVKDLVGLKYLIGCEVTRFTKDFCLIIGLRCDEPYDLEVEPSNVRLLTKYFPQKFGFAERVAKLQRAFKECEDEDDALKMGLVYFAKGVLIGAKSNNFIPLDQTYEA
ncbi:hypothetical protein DVH24_000214 [Malus domestica]|uniref:3'-5' exonuclease domain-containing protein n=1 Tax=Malus domestica TaxID=3750 RepID=A0A498J1Q8_MALDO|nr:hypothetical protein DVH24_000214 [Malus domestica]